MKVNLLRDILALLSGDLARNLFTVLRIRVVTFATTITMIAMMMMMMMMMMMAMMILIILMVTPASPSGEGRQCTPRALVERKPEIILILLIFSFLYLYVSPAFPPALPPALGFHCKPETFEPIAISFSSDHLAHLLLHLLGHLPLHLAALLPRNIRANVFWHLDVNDSEILKGSTVTLLRTTISSKCLDNLYNNT